MSLGKKLFIGGGGGTCFTDSVQPFGADYSSNVALYQLDSDGGTTNNVPDTVGNYNGTATNITYSTGKYGNAAVFNGSSSKIVNTSFSQPSGDLSVSLWVKFNTISSAQREFFDWGGGGAQGLLRINSYNSNDLRFAYGSGERYISVDGYTINTNTWYHLVFVKDGSTGKSYFNNNALTTFSFSGTNTGTGLFLGCNIGSTRFSDCTIDQVRVYDKALSSDEVTTLYNETTSTASDTNVLGESSGVALYSLDYDASDTGGNYNGSANSNVTFGVEGKINTAADFTGGGVVTVPNNVIYGDNHSVSVWFKLDNTSGYQGIFDFDYNNRIIFRVASSDANEANIGTSGWFAHNINFSANQWYHLVVTFSNGNPFKIYVNGNIAYTGGNSSLNAQLGDNNFGAGNASGVHSVNGNIDQLRIFRKELSAIEVEALYEETACVYTSTTDIVNYQGTNLAYYKLDNTAEDETGNYDGTESNITYEFGRFGQAAVFNGSSSNIFNSNRTSTQTTTITLSAWINTTDTTSSMQILQTESLWLRANQVWRIDNANGTGAYRRYDFTQSTIATGNWVHVCVVRDGNSVTLYVNNSAVSFSSETTSSNSGVYDGISIGARNRSSDSNKANFFDGKIDQVRMYNSALDATAVENLYNEKQAYITKNASDPFGDNSEVAFYEFENNANDSTGSNDGTGETQFVTYTSGVGLFGTYVLRGRGDGGITNTSLGTAFRGQTTLSLSAWFNGQNTTYRQTIFSFSDTNDGSTDLWIGIVAGNNTLGFRNVNNGSNNLQVNATGGSNVMDGKWHHVVFTADSGGTHIYVDGLELTGFSYSFGNSSTNIVMPNDLNQFNIGVNEDSGGFEWNWNDNHHISGHQGYLDQIRVFNRALDGDEVFQLWAEHIN